MIFEFLATIDSSYLTTSNDPLAPVGSEIRGTFSYDAELAFNIGSSHYFSAGEAEISVATMEGFSLTMDNLVTNVAPTSGGDAFSVQSFVSEDPNGWNIALEILAPDWLNGSTALPESFPDAFDYGYIQVYFTDEADWVRSIEATIVSIEPAIEEIVAIAETGSVSLTHRETTISLQNTYENPVVFAFVATENGPHPVNVRISDISGTDMTLRLQEPGDMDGEHFAETVHYMVVEEGSWILADGTILEVGSMDSSLLSSDGFQSVSFGAEFDTGPVVLTQVQTSNGPDFVTTRQQGATEDGFAFTMQEEEATNDGRHREETIGWLAIEAGGGSADTFTWLAGSMDGVSHRNSSVTLGDGFDADSGVIAGVSSFEGHNSAWARGNGLAEGAFNVSVEEDTSLDAETRHFAETIDYFAFSGEGTLDATAYGLF